ncbi:ral GTPase-activating protein subunit beta isoform X3 [Zootermopsis nevadensis]|uniref:ral GTPase-activating protein subunit beta isoform X3 n=1 Tax=Zootermopsis nevadensis TaxID=136037 RepID=UPI000B8EA0A9|nr:ral GTPase-activating protein subunit beta isoform X3 [Zootermopsis nevadensis]
MNLGVFNRVNYNVKDSESGGMYSEWASLTSLIQNGNEDSQSVLGKFPIAAGKEVAMAVVKQLASNLGFAQAAEPSPLTTDREVQWCMEVICFGMSLPLSEHDTIRDCVHVYCAWLSALHPVPKVSVPRPICEDPNLYARKMICHFHNLFVPRKGEGADTINRQAVLCHRVLRTLQHLAQGSNSLTRETWEALLLFLLAINDTLLAPPTVKDDVGDQLCERVLSVLFEVWLLACARCFPSPPLWKTFRETCMNWRHRVALIEQWNRVNLALTARLLEFMYGPSFPELKICEEDAQLIPALMTNDCIAQSWFRFLHCLGNPANLCRPAMISQTQKFLQFAITSENVIDPCQHPCLASLPLIFLKAVKGIAGQVDAFLGIAQPYLWDEGCSSSDRDKRESGISSHPTSVTHSPTPPPQRRLAKSFSVAPSAVTKGIPKASLIGLTSSRTTSSSAVLSGHTASTPNSGPSSASSLSSVVSLGGDSRQPLAPARPKCNSILHMFGEWLFEAAHIGCEAVYHGKGSEANTNKRPSSLLLDNRKGSLSLSQPGSLSDDADIPPAITIDKYEAGQAEALGALCRIFCAKKTGEEILPVYLARFYLALQQGLHTNENRECGETLASILLNSADLFRLDLDGVQVLLPHVINALEIVLPEKELKLKSSSVSKTELRRASIHLLLSMLVLPLHFQNLTIKDLGRGSSERGPLTFSQLKPSLMNLLINALQVESDPQNAQMLLGGLLLSVQDSASAEEVEQVTQPDTGPCSDTTSNLLSSASDTVSSLSLPSDYRSVSLGRGDDVSPETQDQSDSTSSSGTFGNMMYIDYPMGLNKNSAHALFVRATYLVCHRLISSWKTDLNVSLAALELLAGLARIHIRETARKPTDALECKRAVKWLCDYIVYQCSRPPPAHSKDLHSTIVAAFQCAAVWLVAHPYLLQDKDCLTTVLEVVELGISGSKSQGKPGEPVCMKDEKELKPASMRVRDAAEALLTIVLEQVGYFPSPCGAESLWSLLDEVALLRHCNSWPGGDNLSRELAVDRFHYFVVENSTVLALLEEPLGNDQDPQPTVTVLIRGPFGRHAWTMQLRHLPRHKSGTKYHAPNPGRPVPMADVGVHHDVKHRYFPENVDRIPQCKVDKSIPSMESLLTEAGAAAEHAHLSRLVEQQATLETAAGQEWCKDAENPFPECVPPPACHEYQTARLFLSHFGFLSLDAANGNVGSPFMALNTSLDGFCRDLEALDNMSSRTCDTVHVFYVRAGQKTPQEILSNVQSESTVSPHFLEFLLSLGWSVNVFQHPGWTGHISTSWRITQPTSQENATPRNHGGSLYNGDSQVLYWADASSEIAFVVPTRCHEHDASPQFDTSSESTHLSGQGWFERSVSDSAGNAGRGTEKPRTLSLDLDKSSASSPGAINGSGRRRTGAVRHPPPVHSNTKVLVFWTESYEDQLQLPLTDLMQATTTGLEGGSSRGLDERDYFVICLNALASGLLRVKLQGPAGGRTSLATPLVDGMVVSRRVLGSMVRQTALNICRRRRLDNDSYQPPHVRRRLKVQELVQKYRCELSHPELLTYLFSDPPT